MTEPSASAYRFGPFRLDAARRTLARGDVRVPVTSRTFDVLLALVERAGRTVDKDELLRIVWPEAVVEESNLTQQIFMIRRLLGTPSNESAYIVTVPRRGYRFAAAVSHAAVETFRSPDRAAASPEPSGLRLAMPLPADAPLASGAERALTISPDGRTIVYVAGGAAGPRLYRRALDRFDAIPIPSTDGAGNPFFSPDGEWIGFTAARKLQKVRVDGGPAQTICEVGGDVRGAAWSPANVIVFAPAPASSLWQVPADGGVPTPLTTLRFGAGERTHRWPHILPDGLGVMFTVGHAEASSFDEASVAVAELSDPDHRIVLNHATDARCWRPDLLLCARQATLMAAPFDLQRRELTGALSTVVAGVSMTSTGAVQAACSSPDVLVHAPGRVEVPERSLVIVARDGRCLQVMPGGDAIEEPRISPDGSDIVVGRRGRGSDLWLCDRVRQVFRRLTFDEHSFAGIWGSGVRTITYSSGCHGVADLYEIAPDRSGEATLLLQTDFDKVPGSWSPGGAELAYTEYHPESGADIWIFARASGTARPLVRTRFNEYGPRVSPDGRHLAYTGDESGRREVYVVSLPEGIDKCQVSTDGGAEPVWSPDGRELFYRVGHRTMRVDVSRGPHRSGVPTTLFEQRHVPGAVTGLANYDVASDDGAFVFVAEREVPETLLLHVTLRASALPSS